MNKIVIAKKVSEYFKLMQKMLKELHGKDVKSPFQLTPKERKVFFKKVKQEYKPLKKD